MENGDTPATSCRVSIIIPTRDRCDLILKCLESLTAQTLTDFEVIVIDDGSTDDTMRMLENYSQDHPGLSITRLHHDHPLGANPCRNLGIRRAKGSIIAFLDSDCQPHPDWLEKLLAGFTSGKVAAVTGLVEDPEPTNIYELTLRGMHRLARSGPAPRLLAGNMAIRRELLLRYMLDDPRKISLPGDNIRDQRSWGCDEEGIFLNLHAAGYEQVVVPEAVVLHEHYYNRAEFYEQVLRGGRAAARLVHQYQLPPRLDLLPFILGYCSLPFALFAASFLTPLLLLLPICFLTAALAALLYNELARKGKTPAQTLKILPVLLLYYHFRLYGYVTESIAILINRTNQN